jgi:hypothetical protein
MTKSGGSTMANEDDVTGDNWPRADEDDAAHCLGVRTLRRQLGTATECMSKMYEEITKLRGEVAECQAGAAVMRKALLAVKRDDLGGMAEPFVSAALDGTAGKELLEWAQKVSVMEIDGRKYHLVEEPPAFLARAAVSELVAHGCDSKSVVAHKSQKVRHNSKTGE